MRERETASFFWGALFLLFFEGLVSLSSYVLTSNPTRLFCVEEVLL
jgi:hypothetical protein